MVTVALEKIRLYESEEKTFLASGTLFRSHALDI